MNSKSRLEERGNVLFLILIAVALFAALSYAVTSSSRGGGKEVSQETAVLGAAQILNYAAAVDLGFTRVRVLNGVSAEFIHFNNDASKRRSGLAMSNGDLSVMPTDQSLYVFLPNGGGVSAQVFPTLSTTCIGCNGGAPKDGSFGVYWTQIAGTGTSMADLALVVFYLREDVCAALNEKVGIPGIPAAEVTTSWLQDSIPAVGIPTGVDRGIISGKSDFCIRSGDNYVFLHVMQLN